MPTLAADRPPTAVRSLRPGDRIIVETRLGDPPGQPFEAEVSTADHNAHRSVLCVEARVSAPWDGARTGRWCLEYRPRDVVRRAP